MFSVTFVLLLVTWCTPDDVIGGDIPHLLLNKPNCLSSCNDQAGYCGGFCGLGGFCCRKGEGSCLNRYEKVSTDEYHSCVKVDYKSHHQEDEHEEHHHHDFEKCKVPVTQPEPVQLRKGSTPKKLTRVLGELDVLPQEYSFQFDLQPKINSSVLTKYEVVLFDKNNPQYNGVFRISGRNGMYYVYLCGTMSGEDGQCTEYLSTHRAGEWIRVHVHQSRNDLDLLELRMFVNEKLLKVVTNTIPVDMHNVKVISIVLPYTPDAGRIRNAYFGSCVSKFDNTATAY